VYYSSAVLYQDISPVSKEKLLNIMSRGEKSGGRVLKRDVGGRWALDVGRPPVPRVDSLLKSFQWQPRAMSTVGQGDSAKEPGVRSLNLSSLHLATDTEPLLLLF